MKKFGQQSFAAMLVTLTVGLGSLGTATSAVAGSLSDLLAENSGNTSQIANNATLKVVPVHEAFGVFPEQKGNQLTLRFEVKDGYYLYQNKIKLELPPGVTATPLQFSLSPQTVNDPDFGQVPVFEKSFTATTTLAGTLPTTSADSLIKWQGCAKAGLCYPPEKTAFTLASINAVASDAAIKASPNVAAVVQNASVLAATSASTSTTLAQGEQNIVANKASRSVNNAVDDVSHKPTFDLVPANADPFGLVAHPLWAMALLFLAGLGLAFTPCVLPMLPIVANIIARQHKPSAKKGLLLTSGYGLGVATSYGLLGAIIAVFGQSLGIINWLQNPVILLSFAGFFVLLGLYMLDRLPIRLPTKFSQQLNKLTQIGENRLGSVTGSFITGFFSALVVSPCVSAPLAGALAGVATAGNPVTGFFALFMLGLGLSTPLILLGATQGNFMPKSGVWMTWVKTGFALLLFAVALLMVERVFVTAWVLGLWAIWFVVVAGWAWQWQGRGKLVTKAVTLMLAVWAGCLVVGMASGATDSWQPLKPLLAKNTTPADAQPVNHQRLTTLAQLNPIIASQQKILVDVTADWCIECRIMDKNLFANPPANLQQWQVVRLDVTDDTPESRAIYEQLKVFGPPVLLYFDQGKLVLRQNGEVKRNDFEQALQRL